MAFSVTLASGTAFVNGVTQLNAANLNAAVNSAVFASTANNSFLAFDGSHLPIDGTFGTSLSFSAGGVLNAIQDIRTTAVPTFAGLTATGSISSTVANNVLTLRSSAGNTTNKLSLGTTGEYSLINYDDVTGFLTIGQPAGRAYGTYIITNGATVATFTGTGLNSTDIGQTTPGKVGTIASATGGAGLNVPHGVAPTAPVNGDLWTTTAGLFVRINGVTKTVTLT